MAFSLLFHVLLALALVIALGRILNLVLSRFGQPSVIGEILAGIMLGPSLLGEISPAALEFLLPERLNDPLAAIAQLGAILYMFVVGLELNTERVRESVSSIFLISQAALIGPFLSGLALAAWLYPRVAEGNVTFLSFALFVGIALAITAFPVLACIIKDRGLDQTRLGLTTLGAAALVDVAAWCILAVIVGIANRTVEGAIVTVLAAGLFVTGMLLIGRPLIYRVFARVGHHRANPSLLAAIVLAVLVCSILTEGIGVHALFGAFLLGALIPHDCNLSRDASDRISGVVVAILLPAFFAYTGLRTKIGLLEDLSDWWTCGVIVVVAHGAKFLSSMLAARFAKYRWRQAAAIGSLMSTRGLMELIVLNIGLDLGIISPRLFAMMVVMALATTILASPVAGWLLERDRQPIGPDQSESALG